MSTERTRRQEIIEFLRAEQWSFDDLRHDFGLTVRTLEEDLRHIQRTVRTGGERLVMDPARCEGCEFIFSSTALHPPGRCPRCRNRRITGPWLQVKG